VSRYDTEPVVPPRPTQKTAPIANAEKEIVTLLTLDRKLLILVSLAGGPKHGYALMNDIMNSTGVRIGAGTLYGCIATLEAAGMIVALPTDARRRPYQLTSEGKRDLEEYLAASTSVAKLGLSRLATP
jgi:DNA-binding PadR family transcriptional regulator